MDLALKREVDRQNRMKKEAREKKVAPAPKKKKEVKKEVKPKKEKTKSAFSPFKKNK